MTETPRAYRQKPVVVQAMRFTRESGPYVWEWADSKPMYDANGKVCGLRIYTLECDMKADFGDWVIRGTEGEFYPCKPAAFAATFEAV